MDDSYDLIIIGGGPAGYTAGIYASRALLNTLIITSYIQPPQVVLTDIVENYPGFPEGINGFDFIEKVKQQAEKFGCKMTVSEVVKIEKQDKHFEVHLSSKAILKTKAIIIASGRRNKKLSVEKEEEFIGKGISYCAVCDAPLYRYKTVAVIGGGDTAFSEAIYLTKFVNKLYLIHRREQFRATKLLQKRLLSDELKDKVEVVIPYIVEKFVGEDRLNGVVIRNLKTNNVEIIHCDGVFVCIGYQPNTEFLNGIVKLDDNGYIITDINLQTSQPGIFACGDCRQNTLKQVVYACADGAKAALSAVEFIENNKF